MIEGPSVEQKKGAVWNEAARMLADGREVETVRIGLRKRGCSEEEIAEFWPEVERRFSDFVGQRRRRLLIQGICWLVIGALIPAGLVWYYGFVPGWLVLAIIPAWYGFYLLGHSPLSEPKIKPPAFFGRGL